jgi:hypothetical protein
MDRLVGFWRPLSTTSLAAYANLEFPEFSMSRPLKLFESLNSCGGRVGMYTLYSSKLTFLS